MRSKICGLLLLAALVAVARAADLNGVPQANATANATVTTPLAANATAANTTAPAAGTEDKREGGGWRGTGSWHWANGDDDSGSSDGDTGSGSSDGTDTATDNGDSTGTDGSDATSCARHKDDGSWDYSDCEGGSGDGSNGSGDGSDGSDATSCARHKDDGSWDYSDCEDGSGDGSSGGGGSNDGSDPSGCAKKRGDGSWDHSGCDGEWGGGNGNGSGDDGSWDDGSGDDGSWDDGSGDDGSSDGSDGSGDDGSSDGSGDDGSGDDGSSDGSDDGSTDNGDGGDSGPTPTDPVPSPPTDPVPSPPTETPSPPPTPTDPPAPGTVGGCPDIQATLDAHNAARSARGAAALVWNDTLASYAQDVSNTCKFQHSNGPYGENLAMGVATCKEAVDLWLSEAPQYDPAKGFDPTTGHFTQVVWKATTQLVICGPQAAGSMSLQRGGAGLQLTRSGGREGELCHSEGHEDEQKLRQQATAALQATFGYDKFRGNQLDAIVAALQRRDVFVLMPTGGGKSLCYALPAAMRPGLVLVVSPLIALIEDQVQSLRARGLRADHLSSPRSESDRRRVLADLQQRTPDTQLLYVTPELLATEGFMRCLRNAYAAGALLLAAVDEAHMISSWGHDFRPTYRRLAVLRQELPRLPLMALTATASERVQRDIVQQLRMRDPLMLRASFNRPNIAFQVRYLDLMRGPQGQPPQTPLPDIIAHLEASNGGSSVRQTAQQQQQQQEAQQAQQRRCPCTIIYTHRREDADSVAAALRKCGFACAAYHAGLPDATRSRVLQEWQAGSLSVIAATVAFGMGVDKADVRSVIHYSLPKSLSAFYQEAGRAGRDGQPSQSIVYYSTEDRQRIEYVLAKGDEERQEKRQARQGARASSGSSGGAGGTQQKQLQAFGQVVDYCLSASCRRAKVLAEFGEGAPPPPAGGAATCCDACARPANVAASIQALRTAGAQRLQRFAGGRHALDFGSGGRGGGGGAAGASRQGALEFETSWAAEGLDYDQEGPSRALQDSEEEDALQGDSSEDEEAAAAAAAAQQRAHGGREEQLFAQMARAEQRYEQEHEGGGKRARLLQKLESGGSGSRGAAGGGPGGGSASGLTDALRQTATRQLAAAIAGNAALAAGSGGSGQAASLAAVLEQQLAVDVSKSVYQSKLASLVLQIKKAQSAADVPALAAHLPTAAAGGAAAGAQQEGSAAAAAAAGPAAGQPAAVSAQQLQAQVTEAVRLAGAAGSSSAASAVAEAASAAAAAAALSGLAALPVTVQLLEQTGAGKAIQKLRKHQLAPIAAAAGACVSAWKARVLASAGQ
ncbi:ATP-dependent DNA helicase Q-like 3 isoform X1 [Chlorella sorokiniana]|uniref:DNA 3'-5' helicase n=1 Tax=Chlorella sorokiniana TaxID=3076 RepID=A0A2P6U0B9_CHLSO|nr:ATP-dependent DNA helicase Q-like 3 isoform X1 [Chlorella sorokiniana]|eukprot:PRW59746.1 ATP-dependent DNA helicase Q-like 3 isoform X1 [Chlorella sorokiniana]